MIAVPGGEGYRCGSMSGRGNGSDHVLAAALRFCGRRGFSVESALGHRYDAVFKDRAEIFPKSIACRGPWICPRPVRERTPWGSEGSRAPPRGWPHSKLAPPRTHEPIHRWKDRGEIFPKSIACGGGVGVSRARTEAPSVELRAP